MRVHPSIQAGFQPPSVSNVFEIALKRVARKRRRPSAGFTLIELMIVIFILLILVSIAIPQYQGAVRRARESVLRQNLYDMRKLISEYTLDKQKAPQSLEDLTQGNPPYLKTIPKDPMTEQPNWETDPCPEDTISSPDAQDTGGICDVHSSSNQLGTDGTAYSAW